MTTPWNRLWLDRASIPGQGRRGEHRDIALARRRPAGLESRAFPTDREVPGHGRHFLRSGFDPSVRAGNRRRRGPRGSRGAARAHPPARAGLAGRDGAAADRSRTEEPGAERRRGRPRAVSGGGVAAVAADRGYTTPELREAPPWEFRSSAVRSVTSA